MPNIRSLFISSIALCCSLCITPLAAHAAQPLAPLVLGKPLTVRDTIEAVLLYHKSLKAIQENRESLVAALQSAKAGWGPRLNVVAAATLDKTSNPTTRSLNVMQEEATGTNVGATLVQPIWDGLATYNRVGVAEANLSSMEYRVVDNATSLALEGVIAHVDILRNRKIFQLSEYNVTRHRETLRIARDRILGGTDTEADVSQTEGRLARAMSSLSEARTALLAAEDTYTRLTGIIPTRQVLVAPAKFATQYTDLLMVIEQAKRTNPTFRAFTFDIASNRKQQELAKASFHPQINFELAPNYGETDGSWSRDLSIMTTLSWNIFNSGADLASIEAAKSRVRQSVQFRDDFWDSLTLEIQVTWTDWKSAIEQQRYYEEAITFNQQTLQAYLEQFMLGSRSMLDVLDAEGELFTSSTQAITASSNASINAYKLFALSGLLLPELGIDEDSYATLPYHNE